MNRPFLKWAGNKYKVLSHLLPLIGTPKRYCEPFAGSLAVSLNVSAEEYIINDINSDLIAIYQALLSETGSEFVQGCKELFVPENNEKDAYLELRDKFNKSTDANERAKLFIYLNRHCFNGLSRFNKKGAFNVPFGKYTAPKFPEDELNNFREYFLSKNIASFYSLSFEDPALYMTLEAGDVVYFDPPYVPASDTANFTSYATDGFCHIQQEALVEIAKFLSSKGVKVIISNHDVPITRELYKDATIHSIQVSRTISAKGSSRNKVAELIAVY